MSKSEKIAGGEAVSVVVDAGAVVLRDGRKELADNGISLAMQIMNAMEQGIIVWSSAGVCELHNTRIFDVMELPADALMVGTTRDDFLDAAAKRGEFSDERKNETKKKFANRAAFKIDRVMPSGRIVASYARPTREGGFVVTFTDVSEVRRISSTLAEAKQSAESAESHAKQVLQDERARRAESRALSDLDEWLQSCKSLSELFMIVEKFLAGLIPDSRGELYLYSNSRDVLDGVCEWGKTGTISDHILADECWALRRGRAYHYSPHALCFPCEHLSGNEEDVKDNYICVPVVAHGDTVGLLHVQFDKKCSHSDAKKMGGFATRCAEHISMAIANVKLRDELHDQSIRDPLTGLYNRRYFLDAMRREMSVSDRGGTGFGLISLDADKFKAFNDNHGHDAGDAVLRALAEQMVASLPKAAVSARVGGEEFAVLLPQSNIKDSLKTAEKLRAAIADLEVRTSFEVLPKVTISSGVTAYSGDGTSPSVLIKRADQALYAAKAAGRNCVKEAATTGK